MNQRQSSRHTLKAIHPELDIEVAITFLYRPGAPEQPPTYSHGGLPADPPEVEFMHVNPCTINGQETVGWAEAYLGTDEGLTAAIELAQDARERQ